MGQTTNTKEKDKAPGSEFGLSKTLKLSRAYVLIIFVIALALAVFSFADMLKARQLGMSDMTEFERRAQTLDVNSLSRNQLDIVARRALETSPPNMDLSRRANDRLLALNKACLNCQIRKVIIEDMETGTLSENALTALRESFKLSPYGTIDLMQTRIRITSRHWDILPQELQTQSLKQIAAIANMRDGSVWLEQFSTEVDSIQTEISQVLGRDLATSSGH